VLTTGSVGVGLSLPIIGKLLDHTQASTTQRYAHLDSDPLRLASDKIAANISMAMGASSGTNQNAETAQELSVARGS
jgi:hypothetical protein